ncbi:MAG: hypothetical protein SGARI_007478, partial [Bacillariaceae sp.]
MTAATTATTAEQKRHPFLHTFLQERLPELGLDIDTYGPYVWGGDGDDNEVVDISSLQKDPEELEGVVELLQASSESHSDDEQVWKELLQNIQREIGKDIAHHQALQEASIKAKKEKMEQGLEKAKLEQQISEKEEKPAKPSQNSAVDDETKRLLMQRYGYDEPDAESGEAAAPSTATTNKQAAQEQHMAAAKDARSKQKTSKKEEQQKTKES